MRHLFLLMISITIVIPATGQQQIEWRKDKVTQLIFPTTISKFRPGYIAGPAEYFDAITYNDGRVLYIQPVVPRPETNLNVITADGRYYAFNLIYNDAARQMNYIIEASTAIFQEQPGEVTALTPGDNTIPQHTEPQTPQAETTHQQQEPPRLFAKVKTQSDYIVTNNVSRLQKLTFVLKGVYADQRHVFFKFSIENASNVPFDVDYIAFSITARKTKKASSQERIQILPVAADTQVHRIDAKSTQEVIYCFEKFTIGKDKLLLAELLERDGDRNIGLRVPENFIIDARKL